MEQYQVEAKPDVRKAMAQKMIETFLLDTSFMEINVNSKTKQQISSELQEKGPCLDLFDDIAKELRATVLSDTFSRFKQSPLFVKAFEKQKKRKGSLLAMLQSDSNSKTVGADDTFEI